MDEAVADYQLQRYTLAAPELTLSTARLAPLSNRVEAFYRAASYQPEAVRRIFGVLSGSIPIRDVYTGPQQMSGRPSDAR